MQKRKRQLNPGYLSSTKPSRTRPMPHPTTSVPSPVVSQPALTKDEHEALLSALEFYAQAMYALAMRKSKQGQNEAPAKRELDQVDIVDALISRFETIQPKN